MMKSLLMNLIYVAGLLLFSSSSFATNDSPQTFTLDGQLFHVNSTSPLIDSGAQVKVQILDPSETCVIYEETQNVNTSNSEGYFNIQVGSVPGSSKRSGLDMNQSMQTIFQNSTSIPASSAPGKTCVGGAYSPSAGHFRYFRITVIPSNAAPDTLTPDMVLDSVPNAIVAQSVQGLDPSNILQTNTSTPAGEVLTQANLESLFTPTAFANLGPVLAGKYVQNGVGGATLPTFTSTPAVTAAGDIWYNSTTSQLVYSDGTSTHALGTSGAGVTSITTGPNLSANGTAGGTLNASGTIDLASIGTAGTYSKVVVDAYGRVTGHSALTETDLPTLSTAGKVSGGAITSGAISGTTSISTSGNLQTTGDITGHRFFIYDQQMPANYVGFQIPSSGTTSYTLTLPPTAGSPNYVLTTNGTGTLSWAAAPADATKVPLAGGTMTGLLLLSGDPTANLGAATKEYVDAAVSSGAYVSLAGGTMTGALVNNTNSASTAVAVTQSGSGYAATFMGGNVGIGTTNPTSTLHVNGPNPSLTVSGTSSASLNIQGNSSAGLNFQNATASDVPPVLNFAKFGGSGLPSANNQLGAIIFNASTSGYVYQPTAAIKAILSGTPTDSGMPTYLSFYTTPTSSISSAERMRIDTSGNVGIGTTSPSSIFDINGAQTIEELAAASAPTPAAGKDFIYADNSTHTLKVSLNGAAYANLSTSGATGTVTSVTSANSDIAVTNTTTTPTLTLNSGTGASQIVKLDTSAKLPAVDGSQLSNLNTSQFTAGLLPFARGGTGAALAPAGKGEIVYANSTSALTSLAAGTSGYVLTSGGAGNAPTWAAAPADATKVPLAGGTMTGLLILSADPSNVLGAATKEYVDSAVSSGAYVPLAGGTMTGALVNNTNSASTALAVNQAGSGYAATFMGGNVGFGNNSPSYPIDLSLSSAATGGDIRGGNFSTQFSPSGTSTARIVGNYNSVATQGMQDISGAQAIAQYNQVYNNNGNANNIGNVTVAFNQFQNAATTGNIIGSSGASDVVANTSTGTIGGAIGTSSQVSNTAGGTVSYAYAAHPNITNSGAGTISNAYGLYVDITNSGGGAITNSYGIYLNAINGTNKFGIYESDATAPNYFAANIGIGTNSPSSTLDINGAQTIREIAPASAPPAAAGKDFIYADNSTHTLKLSVNGGAYNNILTSATSTGGTVTSVTSANSDISVANTTTTPTLTLNSGTGASQIVKLDTSSRLPAVDGSLLSNLSTAQLGAGILPFARGGTGAALSPAGKGEIVYANSTTALASLAAGNSGYVLTSGGAGNAPVWAAAPGDATKVPLAGGTMSGLLYLSADPTSAMGAVTKEYVDSAVTSGAYVPLAGGTMTGALRNNTNSASTAVAVTQSGSGYAATFMGGSVGIGTSTPAASLDVVGSVNATGTLTTSNGITSTSITASGAGSAAYPALIGLATTTNGNSQVSFLRAEGTTFSSPVAVGDGDAIGQVVASAYNGTQYNNSSSMTLSVDGPNAAGSGLAGGRIDFAVRGTSYTNQYGFGVSAMTIRNSGNVGIGTPSPSAALQVVQTQDSSDNQGLNLTSGLNDANLSLTNTSAGGATWFFDSTGNSAGIGGGKLAIGSGTSWNGISLLMNTTGHVSVNNNTLGTATLNVNGTLGVGTLNPVSSLDVAGGMSVGSYAGVNGAPSNGILVSGKVGIATNNPQYQLDVAGDVNASGCLRSSVGTVSGVCASDERIKTGIQAFNLGLDALEGINPKLFRYNGLGQHAASTRQELGVIAQDVEKTAPSIIEKAKVKLHSEDKNLTEIKEVNYTALTYILINSVKELYHKITQKFEGVDRRIASVETKIDADSKAENQEIQKLKQENATMKAYLCAKDPAAPFCKTP